MFLFFISKMLYMSILNKLFYSDDNLSTGINPESPNILIPTLPLGLIDIQVRLQ